jgi:methylase of polypeptide subunit release factors
MAKGLMWGSLKAKALKESTSNHPLDEVIAMNVNEHNQIHNGDCLDLLKDVRDNSIDAVTTDPPYLVVSRLLWKFEGRPSGVLVDGLTVARV